MRVKGQKVRCLRAPSFFGTCGVGSVSKGGKVGEVEAKCRKRGLWWWRNETAVGRGLLLCCLVE